MTRKQKIKVALEPALGKHPELVLAGWGVLFRPINFYIRGLAIQPSSYDENSFYVSYFVYPLFEASGRSHISWGTRTELPDLQGRIWESGNPNLATEFSELLEKIVMPATQGVTSGVGFSKYLSEHRTDHGWKDWGRALAAIHMGEISTACTLLEPLAKHIEAQLPRLLQQGVWGRNLVDMYKLTRDTPLGIPAHCEETTRLAVKANKLEKLWEREPFWTEKQIERVRGGQK